MPTCDYRCERGHRYEKREPFGSPAEQPCDRCGRTARRVLTVPAISFKGSGWYSTDSRGSRDSEPSTSASSSADGDSSKKKKPSGKTGSSKASKSEQAAAD